MHSFFGSSVLIQKDYSSFWKTILLTRNHQFEYPQKYYNLSPQPVDLNLCWDHEEFFNSYTTIFLERFLRFHFCCPLGVKTFFKLFFQYKIFHEQKEMYLSKFLGIRILTNIFVAIKFKIHFSGTWGNNCGQKTSGQDTECCQCPWILGKRNLDQDNNRIQDTTGSLALTRGENWSFVDKSLQKQIVGFNHCCLYLELQPKPVVICWW